MADSRKWPNRVGGLGGGRGGLAAPAPVGRGRRPGSTAHPGTASAVGAASGSTHWPVGPSGPPAQPAPTQVDSPGVSGRDKRQRIEPLDLPGGTVAPPIEQAVAKGPLDPEGVQDPQGRFGTGERNVIRRPVGMGGDP